MARLVERHVLDSLGGLEWVVAGPVLDLGSGAGFPGIPLAVALPDVEFVLCDRHSRKARFLRQVVNELGLDNAVVWDTDLGQRDVDAAAKKFATVVSRGVDSAPALWARFRPLIAPDGRLLVYASTQAGAAMAASMNQLKVSAHIRRHPYKIAGLDSEHEILEINQGSAT